MDVDLTPLKTFAASRPVAYGAPTAAVLGVVLGLVFRVGSQTEPDIGMESYGTGTIERTAAPIAWPSGRVPDYVIGTDFLAAARAPPPPVAESPLEPMQIAAYPIESPPPVVTAARPARDETRWASTQGDILDVRLPEDVPAEEPRLN